MNHSTITREVFLNEMNNIALIVPVFLTKIVSLPSFVSQDRKLSWSIKNITEFFMRYFQNLAYICLYVSVVHLVTTSNSILSQTLLVIQYVIIIAVFQLTQRSLSEFFFSSILLKCQMVCWNLTPYQRKHASVFYINSTWNM